MRKLAFLIPVMIPVVFMIPRLLAPLCDTHAFGYMGAAYLA